MMDIPWRHSRNAKVPVALFAAICLGGALVVPLRLSWDIGAVTGVPESLVFQDKMVGWINSGETWLRSHLGAATRGLAGAIGLVLDWVESLLLSFPWLFVASAFALLALAYGGIGLAILTMLGVCYWGSVGLWVPAMETLALMGLSVAMTVIAGFLFGILCAQNRAVEHVAKPLLDTMQSMPAFVYLIPTIFFFGIGGASAILATMIYAMPPMVRMTTLGIRQVSPLALEVSQSFGATRFQQLWRVQLPMALPSILQGINQTVMMALSLVVLATFIGAGGLGNEIMSALQQLNVGRSVESGICIVFMAIIFDRISYAIGNSDEEVRVGADLPSFRLLPQSWTGYAAAVTVERGICAVWTLCTRVSGVLARAVAVPTGRAVGLVTPQFAAIVDAHIRQRAFLVSCVIVLGVILVVDGFIWPIRDYPDALSISMRGYIDDAVEWLVFNPAVSQGLNSVKVWLYLGLLQPLKLLFTTVPWWCVVMLFAIVGWLSVGLKFAVATIAALLFIVAGDMWISAMETLATVMVCIIVCLGVGVPLGIFAAMARWFDTILRPVLDTMQTLPAFVYLVPILMFFGGGIVAATIATVIYALPPIVRLTTLGIQQVPSELNEVTNSYGASQSQSLRKVQLPMAIPSITIGLNQAIMMALAMQVITPLIGGKGLGHQVFQGLSLADTGLGLIAGASIVFLAIILDQLSLAWSQKQRRALGLV